MFHVHVCLFLIYVFRARSPGHILFGKAMARLLTMAVMMLMFFGLPGQAKNETAFVGRTTCLPEKSKAEGEGSNEVAVEDPGAPSAGSWPGTAGTKVHLCPLLFLLCVHTQCYVGMQL
jgi:hypothetical protein